MHYLYYLAVGILFGITMLKSGAASWFRIYEMFRFGSFHMYGIIGSALVVGIVVIQVIKRFQLKDFSGQQIVIEEKEPGWKRYLYGGTAFGLGWAISGACPGPMYSLAGAGYTPILVVLASAILGTFVYGKLAPRLPH